jgi:hypothetical protein
MLAHLLKLSITLNISSPQQVFSLSCILGSRLSLLLLRRHDSLYFNVTEVSVIFLLSLGCFSGRRAVGKIRAK